MQPVGVDKFLGEVERRAEVMDSAIDVGLVIAEAEDAGPGGESGVPLGRFLAARRTGEKLKDFFKGGADERLVLQQAGPVGVQREIKRLVVEDLRRPLDGVDLGDFSGYDQARDLEQFVGRDVLVRDDLIRLGWIAQAGIAFRVGYGMMPERVDKDIMLAREDVVEEAEPDVPVVGEGDGFLPRPLGILRV